MKLYLITSGEYSEFGIGELLDHVDIEKEHKEWEDRREKLYTNLPGYDEQPTPEMILLQKKINNLESQQ